MYQKLTIVGNAGSDADMRYTPQGKAVSQFSVATNRKYTDSNGEKVKETTWFRVTAWGKLAEICGQYVKRGGKVLVEGVLKPDKNTGNPRVYEGKGGWSASFEVTASEVRFLGSVEPGEDAAVPVAAEDTEIPF